MLHLCISCVTFSFFDVDIIYKDQCKNVYVYENRKWFSVLGVAEARREVTV